MTSENAKTRFVFVTGGVLSGIGKGVTTAAIAKLFQFRGYTLFGLEFNIILSSNHSLVHLTHFILS